MDDDHLGPRLQHLERGGSGRRAHQALHQTPESPPPGLGLLKQRFARPALIDRHEVEERDDRRAGGAPPVHEQGAALRQHAAGDDLRQGELAGIEDGRAGHRVEHHQQARACRFHEQ